MSRLPWYVARAAGLLSWTLVTASVLWGLALSTKLFGRRPHPAWLLDLHRYLGGLASIFTAVHVAGVLADHYVHFTLWWVLVPFASHWRPSAVAWGVVGLYLLAAVELTSLARHRLPRRVWRAVHGASLPLFVVATIHGLTAGSDTRSLFAKVIAGAAVSVVGGLLMARMDQSAAPRPQRQSTPRELVHRP